MNAIYLITHVYRNLYNLSNKYEIDNRIKIVKDLTNNSKVLKKDATYQKTIDVIINYTKLSKNENECFATFKDRIINFYDAIYFESVLNKPFSNFYNNMICTKSIIKRGFNNIDCDITELYIDSTNKENKYFAFFNRSGIRPITKKLYFEVFNNKTFEVFKQI